MMALGFLLGFAFLVGLCRSGIPKRIVYIDLRRKKKDDESR
jgi:hypothetical protein